MEQHEALHFFGKVPSRGDFVRSPHSPALIQTLDRWLSGTLDAMASDPRWKEVYDRATPVHVAVMGPRNPVSLAGHLMASHDASGRRFPFITAARCPVAQPQDFLAEAPLRLSRAWHTLGQAARQAVAEHDASEWLAAMGSLQLPPMPAAAEQPLADFLARHALGQVQAWLRQAGHEIDLRQAILALGLLLQPLPGSGARSLDKGLWLPLPEDPLWQPAVAAFWLSLVAGFVARADFELLLLMPQPGQGSPPVAALGFSGASARTLQAWFDPEVGREVFIDLRDAGWVDEHLGQDYALHKLSSYLRQGELSLAQALRSFQEAFLGL